MSLMSVADHFSRREKYAFEWALVDVETSGLRPHQHRVLSVAVLTVDAQGVTTGEFSTLLDPGCDPGPVHIHGLTAERLRGAPQFEEVADRIGSMVEGRILVAHNAQFDYDFLVHEFARARSSLPVSRRLCTLALNRRVAPMTADLKLGTLAAHYGVTQHHAHDALDDTRVLAGVLRGSLAAADRLGLDLPLVACPPKQGSGFPPRIPKTPCAFRNPGRLTAGDPLVQGMKIAFTGDTALAREELVARAVAAGLNVMTSVSRHSSVLVTNDAASDSAKADAARAAGVPVIDEKTFLELLECVSPGVTHQVPAARGADSPPPTALRSLPSPRQPSGGPATPGSAGGPLAGRRVLVLGGDHEQATSARVRVVELGASAAVNLSARVTDVLVLAGGEADRRMPRVAALEVLVRDADWLDEVRGTSPKPTEAETTPSPQVIPRGGVTDLPSATDGTSWTVTATWSHQASCEVDVVAFILDGDEQVTEDADFVFYGAPESPGGAIRLTTDGPTEQAVTMDLAMLSGAARKIVIAAAIDGETTFGAIGPVEASIATGRSAQPLAQATLDAATTERTLLLAEIYRRGSAWRMRAVGQGYDHGLATLARGFGVDVAER